MANKDYFWTEALELALKVAYAIGGLDAATKAIPEKPRGALAVKACRLKLTNPRPRKPKSL